MFGHRQYKLNPSTLMYEVHKDKSWSARIRAVSTVIGVIGLGCLYFWLYTSVLHLELPKTAILRRKNLAWQEKMSIMQREMELCEESLEAIENRDDGVYRAIFGLNRIPKEVRNAGFGGVNRYEALEQLGAGTMLKDVTRRMDILMKRTSVQSESLDQIYVLSSQAGDMASCLPAVPPILPEKGSFRISSSFGGRSDPVYGVWRFHEGIDMASKKGNPVYATGDGVVEKAHFQYYGYGNEVIIDHGYGYKTRYAHLNSILVAEGARVHRGDQIGELGNSGKSTGPHLHYEVIYKGSKVNPLNYFDMEMPTEEYRAMIKKRWEESESNKRTTTGDVIRRVTR